MTSRDNILMLHLLSFIFQVILFVVLHDGIVVYYSKRFVVHAGVQWGLAINLIFYKFFILIFIQNILIFFFVKRHLLISTIVFTVFCLILIPYYKVHPLRTLNIAIAGLFAVCAKYFFSYIFKLLGGLKIKK